MTKERDKPSSPSAVGRATRRGLGMDARRDATSATGEFPLSWPELPEDPDLPASDDETSTARAEDTTNSWDRHSLLVPPGPPGSPSSSPARDELVASLFDVRPQSRGPEYHPPALPAPPRQRPAPSTSPTATTGTGTYRVGSPLPSFRSSPPDEVTGETTVPPFERPARASSRWPFTFGTKRLYWAAVAGLVLGTGVALAVVRVPVRAWGVLRATGTPESLTATVSGSVAVLRVAAGDEVATGDALIEIHSPELQANLDNRHLELDALHERLDATAKAENAALQRNLVLLQHRRNLLDQRLQLKDAEAAQRKSLLDQLAAKVSDGSLPTTALLEPSAAVQAAQEERLGISDELAQIEIAANDRKLQAEAAERARQARLSEAETQLLQAQNAAQVSTVRAPAPGWIESLLVTRGSSVQAGAELARLVPHAAPRGVIALLAVEDATDVSVGEEARVELGPRAHSSGVLSARVKHVSREVASAARVQAILGGPSREGFVQLELELVDSPEFQALEPKLRVGAKAIVSFSTPHRRLGGVLSDALRDWWASSFWG
jgi:multidrug resistance efflux pump